MEDTPSGYRTQQAYERENAVSGSMEDYLEMTLRLSPRGEPVRVSRLSAALSVSPSSASKMAADGRGLVSFEKYGFITLSAAGREYGGYLIRRHEAVNRLLCLINGTAEELSETEKTGHFLSRRTVESIGRFPDAKAGGADE